MKLIGSLRLLVLATSCLSLSACGGQRRGAEEVVRNALKDPESARFGHFYYNGKTKKACLTVNAKNSMGGYTGDKQVKLLRDHDGWQYLSEDEIDAATCREIHADAAG